MKAGELPVGKLLILDGRCGMSSISMEIENESQREEDSRVFLRCLKW